MGRAWTKEDDDLFAQSESVDSFDALRSAIPGADIDIVQLRPGRMTGHLLRGRLLDIGFALCTFSVPIRSDGVFSKTKSIVGKLLMGSAQARGMSEAMLPNDVFVNPPASEHYAVYTGATSVAALILEPDDLATFTGDEFASSAGSLPRQHQLRPRPCEGEDQAEILLKLLGERLSIRRALPPDAQRYWKNAVLESFLGNLSSASLVERDHAVTSATRIVREVEEYVANRYRAVHISEICGVLKVSRRTLFRAFEEVVGQGPIAFLRAKRLSAVHSILRRSDPRTTAVTDVAIRFGFLELGRFSCQYRELFGEYPRETLHGRSKPIRKPGRNAGNENGLERRLDGPAEGRFGTHRIVKEQKQA